MTLILSFARLWRLPCPCCNASCANRTLRHAKSNPSIPTDSSLWSSAAAVESTPPNDIVSKVDESDDSSEESSAADFMPTICNFLLSHRAQIDLHHEGFKKPAETFDKTDHNKRKSLSTIPFFVSIFSAAIEGPRPGLKRPGLIILSLDAENP